jgi:hypothetical protein
MSSTIRTILIIVVFALVTIWLFYSPNYGQNAPSPVEITKKDCGCESCKDDKKCGDSEPEQIYKMIGAGDVESDVLLEGYDNVDYYAGIESDIESFDGSIESSDRVYEDSSFMPQLTNRKEALTETDYDSFRIMDHTDHIRSNHQNHQNHPNNEKKINQKQEVQGNEEMNNIEYMSPEEYISMVNMRPHMETYNDIDESSGEYVDGANNRSVGGDTINFKDLPATINKYRNAAIRDIRNGGEHDGSVDREFKFYDGIQ